MILVQNKQAVEDDIRIDFSGAINVWNYDRRGKFPMSHCMCAVDFIVEWPKDVWLVEIKDPTNPAIPLQYCQMQLVSFNNKLTSQGSDSLFHNELAPKVKDTFLYLYLSNLLQEKPLRYMVLIGMQLGTGVLSRYEDRLKQAVCMSAPSNAPWKNKYLAGVGLFDLQSWNAHLQHCPAARISSTLSEHEPRPHHR